jgi:uncharacterized protein YprB with RNaseH-like and TPR domain
VHERLRSGIERRRPHWGRVEPPPAHEPELVALAARGLEHALFLDLETCGLSSSTVFLAGTMHWNGDDFVLRQYFARHYGEEAPLLRALGEAMAGFEYLVTFNGKTFDVPFLQGRAVVHGVRLALPPRHLDLLHVARRRWRGEFADCRLKTLESRVCRRRRVGDVPGEEIPGLYHDFVKYGDPYRLVPVFHHNLLDVITMSDILRALCRPARPRTTAARGPPAGRARASPQSLTPPFLPSYTCLRSSRLSGSRRAWFVRELPVPDQHPVVLPGGLSRPVHRPGGSVPAGVPCLGPVPLSRRLGFTP